MSNMSKYDKIVKRIKDANGRRRERTINIHHVVYVIRKMQGYQNWVWDFTDGGNVCRSYGYPASTSYAFACKIHSRRFAITIGVGDAINTYPFGHHPDLRSLYQKGRAKTEIALKNFVKSPDGVITFDPIVFLEHHDKALGVKRDQAGNVLEVSADVGGAANV